jgi:catechol 2,3-dioxygenase-like lactoylglutathione lyase family enzyme
VALSGVNHVAFLTSDIDQLVSFYEEVFGAGKLVDLAIPDPANPGRHVLIDIGAGAALHAFEFADSPPAPLNPMFQRGRLDHFALNVADEETFERLRGVLVARGVSDGTVTDFGVMQVLSFTDPDGHVLELARWVGGTSPSSLDMSKATDADRGA